MYKKNKNKGFLIFIVVCVSLLLASVCINRNFNLPDCFIKDGILFIDKFITKPFDFKRNNDLDERFDQENQELKNYKALNEELSEELVRLESLLNLNSLISDYTYVNATVISRNLDYWSEKILIDKGGNDSIVNGMPVVSNGGLIGITDDVSAYTSSIDLLCNNKFPVNISVKIKADSDIYGILSGYSDGLYEITGISSNSKIVEGATVVTSGYGNIFPSGLLIGTVLDVTTDNFDLSKIVRVKPSVLFDDISYVTVIER